MGGALLVSIAVLFLSIPGEGLAQASQASGIALPICASCNRPITGTSLEALGRKWHPEHFTCTRCRRSLAAEPFSAAEGAPYCARCYAEQFGPRCAACGKPIADRSVTALGKQWHPEHFLCASCQRPLEGRAFVPQEGRPYCEACYHEQFSPKCSVCGAPLEGNYLEDYWGDRFCPRHRDELDKCFSCQRPICDTLTGGGVRYRDGRSMCSLCRRTSVDQVAQGAGAAQRVRQALADMGLDLGGQGITLRLVGLQELGGVRRHPEALSGKTKVLVRKQGNRETGRKVEEILVLHGLPQEHYAAVLAHEYGHAWLFLQRFPALTPQVEEGLCQLLSYQWLARQGSDEAGFFMQLMRNSEDPVYGAGLRQALASLGNRPVAQLAEYLRQHQRFPPP